jgi:hypothetical protein
VEPRAAEGLLIPSPKGSDSKRWRGGPREPTKNSSGTRYPSNDAAVAGSTTPLLRCFPRLPPPPPPPPPPPVSPTPCSPPTPPTPPPPPPGLLLLGSRSSGVGGGFLQLKRMVRRASPRPRRAIEHCAGRASNTGCVMRSPPCTLVPATSSSIVRAANKAPDSPTPAAPNWIMIDEAMCSFPPSLSFISSVLGHGSWSFCPLYTVPPRLQPFFRPSPAHLAGAERKMQ